MVKYSYELKQQVIQDYLDGLGDYKTLAKKYHLPTKSIILQWLNVYEHYGFEGLKIKRKKSSSQYLISKVYIFWVTSARIVLFCCDNSDLAAMRLLT